MSGQRLVTLQQAVEARAWLSERYARRLIAERRIGYSKVGNRIVLNLDELDRLIEEHRVEPVR